MITRKKICDFWQNIKKIGVFLKIVTPKLLKTEHFFLVLHKILPELILITTFLALLCTGQQQSSNIWYFAPSSKKISVLQGKILGTKPDPLLCTPK